MGVSPITAKILSWYRWLSARLQYLQCVSNGDSAVLHWAIDMFDFLQNTHRYHHSSSCPMRVIWHISYIYIYDIYIMLHLSSFCSCLMSYTIHVGSKYLIFGGQHFQIVFSWMNWYYCVLIKFSLKYLSSENKSTLFQEMAWCCHGAKPLLEPMTTLFTHAQMAKILGSTSIRHFGVGSIGSLLSGCIHASLSLSELIIWRQGLFWAWALPMRDDITL